MRAAPSRPPSALCAPNRIVKPDTLQNPSVREEYDSISDCSTVFKALALGMNSVSRRAWARGRAGEGPGDEGGGAGDEPATPGDDVVASLSHTTLALRPKLPEADINPPRGAGCVRLT